MSNAAFSFDPDEANHFETVLEAARNAQHEQRQARRLTHKLDKQSLNETFSRVFKETRD